MLVKKFILNIVVTFSLFSGSYILGGVKIYPPLFFALVGLMQSLFGRKIPKLILNEMRWWTVFLLLVLVGYFFSQNNDSIFVLIRYIVKAILIPFGCCLLIRNLAIDISNKNNDYSNTIRNAVFLALIVQLLVTILQMGLPSFRSYFDSIIELTDEWKMLADMGHFRATGLAGLSIYDTSIAYGLLLFLFLPWCGSKKININFKFLILATVVVILSLIAGRSGFILVFTILSFTFLCYQRKIFYCLNVLTLIVLGLIFAVAIMGAEQFGVFVHFVFEPIYNFIDTGSFQTASTNELIDSYLFIPWNVPPLTGFGFWAQPSLSEPYQFMYKTDSGILLNFIAFGTVGLIYIISYTIHFVKSYLSLSDINGNFSKLYLYILFTVLIFSFILKGPIYFSEKIMTSFFIWLVYNCPQSKNK